jgi:hypothetical protein
MEEAERAMTPFRRHWSETERIDFPVAFSWIVGVLAATVLAFTL